MHIRRASISVGGHSNRRDVSITNVWNDHYVTTNKRYYARQRLHKDDT
jgi:hypothetical protein